MFVLYESSFSMFFFQIVTISLADLFTDIAIISSILLS